MPNTPLLSSYRVLDLSQYIPGPFASRALADLGAEVIKVEPPSGDPMRSFMFAQSEQSTSLAYRHLNRGKTICRLNLKLDSDKRILDDLLQDADVLIESFRPGVLARLGFNRDRLLALNQNLVHCAISGYGQTGPLRERAGHDLTYCAVAGALSASGTADRPLMTFPPIADHAGATQAVNAVLAALLRRERHGCGAFLDISLTESILSWQYLGLLQSAIGMDTGRERGLLNGGAACYNIYRTKDGKFVVLAALEEKFWRTFCKSVKRPVWIARQQEPLPQKALIAELQQLFARQSQQAWCEQLIPADCCFEPVPDMSAVAGHPQFNARHSTGDDAPNYPGWIDGESVTNSNDYIELPEGQIPSWQRGE